MKKNLLLISILLVIISCFRVQTLDFEIGNLWRITSISGKESYIFGTIHLYPKDELELPKNVIAKLEDCKILALERDITNTAQQQKFRDFEMPAYFIENYKALNSEYGDELVSMESQLIEIANTKGIEITGLESTDEILGVMTDLGKIEIPQNHFEKDKIIQVYQQTLEMYKLEQIRLFKDSLVSQLPSSITEQMVDKRNQKWIGDIISNIEKEPTFIAVGMGHLGGKGGLLSILNDKGYKLTRVEL